jgi:hypothetical protein
MRYFTCINRVKSILTTVKYNIFIENVFRVANGKHEHINN